jgi:hypothetical protein
MAPGNVPQDRGVLVGGIPLAAFLAAVVGDASPVGGQDHGVCAWLAALYAVPTHVLAWSPGSGNPGSETWNRHRYLLSFEERRELSDEEWELIGYIDPAEVLGCHIGLAVDVGKTISTITRVPLRRDGRTSTAASELLRLCSAAAVAYTAG